MDVTQVVDLLRTACAGYVFEPVAIFKKDGEHEWPLTAANAEELVTKLSDGSHFLPLPKEPAALANVVEVAVVDFLEERLRATSAKFVRGTERGYPDIELEFDGKFFAVDIKVARRRVNKAGKATSRTDSRITLYTGNTFFMYPTLKWPGIPRPFADYAGHIDIIGLYTLDVSSPTRVTDFELVIAETWRIASKQRSSTTREYLGAVDDISRLKSESGDFASQQEFYDFWRSHTWKIGKAVQKQLQKLLSERK